jgi:hypothetical protein
VVDGVSCGGALAVTALWRYDRRSANGAGFVCFGQKLLGPDAPEAEALRAYAGSVGLLFWGGGAVTAGFSRKTPDSLVARVPSKLISVVSFCRCAG